MDLKHQSCNRPVPLLGLLGVGGGGPYLGPFVSLRPGAWRVVPRAWGCWGVVLGGGVVLLGGTWGDFFMLKVLAHCHL